MSVRGHQVVLLGSMLTSKLRKLLNNDVSRTVVDSTFDSASNPHANAKKISSVNGSEDWKGFIACHPKMHLRRRSSCNFMFEYIKFIIYTRFEISCLCRGLALTRKRFWM